MADKTKSKSNPTPTLERGAAVRTPTGEVGEISPTPSHLEGTVWVKVFGTTSQRLYVRDDLVTVEDWLKMAAEVEV